MMRDNSFNVDEEVAGSEEVTVNEYGEIVTKYSKDKKRKRLSPVTFY